MKVILTCFQDGKSFGPLARRKSVAMLPILNKPLLQYHIEQSVKRGQREVHIVVTDYANEIERFVGNGSRWGIQPRVWLFRDACEGPVLLHRLREKLQGPLLLIPVEILIDWDFEQVLAKHESVSSGMSRVLSQRRLHVEHGGEPTIVEQRLWSDTGILMAKSAIDPDVPIAKIESEGRWIRIDDPAQLWAANLSALENSFPDLVCQGTECQDGIRLGHHTTMSSSATVEGYNCIGNHVTINAKARLRNSIIGHGTFIDENAFISSSLILSNTYVGPEVDVRDSIATGRFIISISIGSWVSIPDPFILTDKRHVVALSAAKRILDRVLAFVLAVATFPLWLPKGLIRRLKGRQFCEKRNLLVHDISEGLRLPEGLTTQEFHYFSDAGPFLSRLPGLFDVLTGRLNLVGVRPLHNEELPLYREEWTWRRFDAPVGLFTPIDAELPADAAEEEKAVLENYYASTRNLRTDLKIMLASLWRLFFQINGHGSRA